MSTKDPISAVRYYIDAFNRGDAKEMGATSPSPGRSSTAWRRTSGRGRPPLRIGIETCSSRASIMGLRTTSSLWAIPYTTTSPATPHTWSSPRPCVTVQGRKVTQTGAVYTVALRRLADGWRIASWAWAKGKQ